ncbi:hypothetical protein C8F04DRAFT_1179433 [Mycena alexandri]|uniref:CCHC-type domain-containing protein n=1 Tax=Mycena alexandri TaxID=1745969 RepID=A0AAD6T2X6_9AGAR|nr:hypothetical protein C8F04DRAFT_1179433 [Mycena alexandri]
MATAIIMGIGMVNDNNPPKFETESADDLMKFVDHANQIFALAGITTDGDRKKRLTDYLSVSKKELWRAMKSYTDGSTYDKFVEDIYKIYPEVKSTKVGSLEALDRLCRQYKGIQVYDEGLLKRFSLEYGTLVKKLLAGKAIITNAEACRRYLETLDSSFSTKLNMTISSQNILKRQMASNNPALVPLVAIADGRKEDTIEIANLIDMAEAMAEGQQGSEALTHGVGSTSHLRDFSVMKKERSEELEDIAGSVAYLKDVVMLMQKDNQSVQSEMMKTLQQALRNPPPVRERDEPPYKEQSKPSSMPSRPSQDDYYMMTRDQMDNSQECYYCDGTGHYARGCPVKEKHIMKGWILVESGKLKLGDGNWIPKGDGPRILSRVGSERVQCRMMLTATVQSCVSTCALSAGYKKGRKAWIYGRKFRSSADERAKSSAVEMTGIARISSQGTIDEECVLKHGRGPTHQLDELQNQHHDAVRQLNA